MSLAQKNKPQDSRTITFSLVLFVVLCCSLVNCTKKSSSGQEEEPKEEIRILATFNATYTLEGTEATGTVRYVGNSKDVTVNLGEQADLGTAPEGETKDVTVYINGNGALQRIFNNVQMSGTAVYDADVLKTTDFNLDDFINEFLHGNANDRWRQNSVVVYFNPDIEGTGQRLPQSWIDETKRTIDKIKEHSAGFMQNVEYHEDGDYTADDFPLPNGACWVFYDSSARNPVNATYPNFDGPVDACRLMFNPDYALVVAIENETIDAFFGENQNFYPAQYKWNWLKFSFMRPAGDEYSYKIYPDREEQEGFDGSVQALASVRVLIEYDKIPDPTAPLRFFEDGKDNFITIKHIIKEKPSKNSQQREK